MPGHITPVSNSTERDGDRVSIDSRKFLSAERRGLESDKSDDRILLPTLPREPIVMPFSRVSRN